MDSPGKCCDTVDPIYTTLLLQRDNSSQQHYRPYHEIIVNKSTVGWSVSRGIQRGLSIYTTQLQEGSTWN